MIGAIGNLGQFETLTKITEKDASQPENTPRQVNF